MDLDDTLATVRSKLSGPVFFPFVFAFVAVNWRALFLLAFHDGTAAKRIEVFDANSNMYSLFLFPFLIATAIVFGSPFLRWGVSTSTRRARVGKRVSDTLADQDVEEKRLEREVILAEKREEIAMRNKRASTTTEQIIDPELRSTTGAALTPAKDISGFTEALDIALLPDVSDIQSDLTGHKWLEAKVAPTFAKARELADRHGKLIFIVVFDSRKRDKGRMDWATDIFFDFDKVRGLVTHHFVLFASDVAEDERFARTIDLDLGEPAYVVMTTNSETPLAKGRLYANRDEAVKIVQRLIKEHRKP